MESLFARPEIALDQLMPIFIVLILVLIFRVVYIALTTLVKMGYLSKKWFFFSFLFWLLQIYSLYDLVIRLYNYAFTVKVLIITMLVYLFVSRFIGMIVALTIAGYEQLSVKKTEFGGVRDTLSLV